MMENILTTLIDILKAVVYGVVQGITEWLPISSTGHLILLEQILPMNVSEGFWDMFFYFIGTNFGLGLLQLLRKKENRYTHYG